MNLREWALEQGVHPKTAYRWFREGKLPVPARRAGRLILVDPDRKPGPAGEVAAYCRVSSAGQKDHLERQAGRVVAGGTGLGLAVGRVVSEVGSGMDGHRRKLMDERSYGLDGEDLTPALGWNLPALRRAWNQAKHEVAPW